MPTWNKVMGFGEEVKTYVAQWEFLTIVDSVLYRNWVAGDGHPRWSQFMLPVSQREEVVRMVHVGFGHEKDA